MDVKRLVLPTFFAAVIGLAAALGLHSQSASAEVVGAKIPAPLAAAVRADVEARGYKYGGDCKFDSMYLAPGMWCSFVESIGPEKAEVNIGRFASDEFIKTTFVKKGVYGWANPATGVGSPELVPLLSAQPGAKADSWRITGINFPANQEVTIFDASGCGGEQRCPTDHNVATVKAGADGAFVVTVQLNPDAKPVPGQVNRLLQVTGGAFIQVAFHHSGAEPQPTPIEPAPTNPAPANPAPTHPANPTPSHPAPANPTPGVPESGDDDKGSDDTNTILLGAIATFGIVTLGAVGILKVANRK